MVSKANRRAQSKDPYSAIANSDCIKGVPTVTSTLGAR